MIDQYDFAIQVLVPWATAATLYALLGRSKEGTATAGCLSIIVATVVVTAIGVWIHGETSTMGIGLMFTLVIAVAVSGLVVAALYGIDKIRSR